MIIYGKTPSDWKNELMFQMKQNKYKVIAFIIYSAILIAI
jgi:hypothetical protein